MPVYKMFCITFPFTWLKLILAHQSYSIILHNMLLIYNYINEHSPRIVSEDSTFVFYIQFGFLLIFHLAYCLSIKIFTMYYIVLKALEVSSI